MRLHYPRTFIAIALACTIGAQTPAYGVSPAVWIEEQTDLLLDPKIYVQMAAELTTLYQSVTQLIKMYRFIQDQARRLDALGIAVQNLSLRDLTRVRIKLLPAGMIGNQDFELFLNLMDGGLKLNGADDLTNGNYFKTQYLSQFDKVFPDTYDPARHPPFRLWGDTVWTYDWGTLSLNDPNLKHKLQRTEDDLVMQKTLFVRALGSIGAGRGNDEDNSETRQNLNYPSTDGSSPDEVSQADTEQKALTVLKAELEFLRRTFEQQNEILRNQTEAEANQNATALQRRGALYTDTPKWIQDAVTLANGERTVTADLGLL